MRFLRIAFALAAPFALAATLVAQSLEVQLQRAVQREIATGDSKAAIVEYKRVNERAGSNRVVAAEALLRLAEAHQRLGFADANTIYEQIVARYADQVAIVSTARARLNRDTRGVAEGLARRRVWTGRAIQRVQGRARISPDSRLLAFASNNWTELIVRDLSTGVERALIRNSSAEIATPIWSRDGKRIAYRYASGGSAEVRVINVDGSAVRTAMRISRDLEPLAIVDWGRGEDILAVTSAPESTLRLLWINATTGGMRTLTDIDDEIHFDTYISPDGSAVVTAGIDPGTGTVQIRLVSANGSSTVLASTPSDFPVGWTPDGRHVLVVSRRSGTIDLWALSVSRTETGFPAWRVDRDLCACGEVDRAMAGQARANIVGLGVTRAGSFYFRMLDFASDIHTAPIGGVASTTASVLPVKVSRTGFNRWPVWSPDGKRIAYVRVPTTGRELFVLDLASGAEQRIPDIARDRAQVCWAGDDALVWRRPKGDRLEFRRYTISTRTDALLFDEPVRDAVGFGCAYEGTTVVFANPTNKTLTVRTVDGSRRNTLPLPAGALPTETFALSPNGQELALFITAPKEQSTSLIVLRLATGETRQIAKTQPGDRFLPVAKGVAWSRDGKFLFYSEGKEGTEELQLVRVASSGGAEQRLGIRAEGLSDLDVGPNGMIAFRAGPMDMPQVVAIENVSIPTK